MLGWTKCHEPAPARDKARTSKHIREDEEFESEADTRATYRSRDGMSEKAGWASEFEYLNTKSDSGSDYHSLDSESELSECEYAKVKSDSESDYLTLDSESELTECEYTEAFSETESEFPTNDSDSQTDDSSTDSYSESEYTESDCEYLKELSDDEYSKEESESDSGLLNIYSESETSSVESDSASEDSEYENDYLSLRDSDCETDYLTGSVGTEVDYRMDGAACNSNESTGDAVSASQYQLEYTSRKSVYSIVEADYKSNFPATDSTRDFKNPFSYAQNNNNYSNGDVASTSSGSAAARPHCLTRGTAYETSYSTGSRKLTDGLELGESMEEPKKQPWYGSQSVYRCGDQKSVLVNEHSQNLGISSDEHLLNPGPESRGTFLLDMENLDSEFNWSIIFSFEDEEINVVLANLADKLRRIIGYYRRLYLDAINEFNETLERQEPTDTQWRHFCDLFDERSPDVEFLILYKRTLFEDISNLKSGYDVIYRETEQLPNGKKQELRSKAVDAIRVYLKIRIDNINNCQVYRSILRDGNIISYPQPPTEQPQP